MHAPSAPAQTPPAPSLTRSQYNRPEFPHQWRDLIDQLPHDAPGEALRNALAPAAVRDGSGTLFLRLKETWDAFSLGHNQPEGLSLWPLHWFALKSQYLSSWEEQYRTWEASKRWEPAPSLEEDWRHRVMRWHQEDSGLDRPQIQRVEIPCPTIPEWREGRTRLVLLPAPGLSPAWLPAVIDSEMTAQELFGQDTGALTLIQGTAMMEVQQIQDVMITPPIQDRPWLLRYAHLQGAAWTVA